jgi:hypothetical protein
MFLRSQRLTCIQIPKVRVKVLPQARELLERIRIAQTLSDGPDKQDIYVFEVFYTGHNQKFLLQPSRNIDEEIHPFDNIAVINQESAAVLSQITSLCTYEATCLIEPWAAISSGTTTIDKEACILVDLVIYGHQEHCDEVGDLLNSRKVYLQEPDYRDTDCGYRNPHFLNWNYNHPAINTDLDPLRSSLLQTDPIFQQQENPNGKVMTQPLLKEKVAAVFKMMTRAQNLKRIAADTTKIHTSLLQ